MKLCDKCTLPVHCLLLCLLYVGLEQVLQKTSGTYCVGDEVLYLSLCYYSCIERRIVLDWVLAVNHESMSVYMYL